MYAQAFGAAPVVSLPVEMLERFGAAAAEAAVGLVDDGRWQAVFGARTDAVVGPALVAYADAGTFRRPSTDADVRLLGEVDRPALDGLRGAVSAEEWDHGGSELGTLPVAARSRTGRWPRSPATRCWGGRIAHLGIVTHPAHRGRGLGAAAVALAAETALRAGLVAQHRTLASNAPSIDIARRLGFVGYATSLAVRLHADMTTTTALMVPGLWDSGPEHWHTHWEKQEPALRPRAPARAGTRPRSASGCARWTTPCTGPAPAWCWPRTRWGAPPSCTGPGCPGRKVRGALLVAPADVDGAGFPLEARGFAPMPLKPLPFPSILVASTDDSYLSLERARLFAEAWGSRLVEVGAKGHLNSASGLGEWPEGRALLDELLALPDAPDPSADAT